jgi:hypothetical protein
LRRTTETPRATNVATAVRGRRRLGRRAAEADAGHDRADGHGAVDAAEQPPVADAYLAAAGGDPQKQQPARGPLQQDRRRVELDHRDLEKAKNCAAIHLEGDAGDVVRRLRAEEGDDAAEVGGVAHALDVAAPELSHAVGGVATGRGGVDRDAVRKEVLGGVLIHAHRAVRAVFDSASVGIGCFTEYDVMQQMRPHGSVACTAPLL